MVVGLSLCALLFASASTNDVSVYLDFMYGDFVWGTIVATNGLFGRFVL